MATLVYVKPILPRIHPQSSHIVRAKIRAVTKRVCDMAAEELRYLVETWEHQPPPIVRIAETADKIGGMAIVIDPIMFYLDGGTSIRWAVMTKDFQPKTYRRSLRSSYGAGGVEIRGRGNMTRAGRGPQPGIEAREFSIALMEKYIPIFEWGINMVMQDAIQKGEAF